MKRPTISNIPTGQIACFTCAICGACPGLTLGTAISGVTLF